MNDWCEIRKIYANKKNVQALSMGELYVWPLIVNGVRRKKDENYHSLRGKRLEGKQGVWRKSVWSIYYHSTEKRKLSLLRGKQFYVMRGKQDREGPHSTVTWKLSLHTYERKASLTWEESKTSQWSMRQFFDEVPAASLS
jgi:hypothetical protein